VQSVVADPSLKELAARTEVRPIETLTLTDQQFLTGDKSRQGRCHCRGVAPAAAGALGVGFPPSCSCMVREAPARARSSGRKPSTKWESPRSWWTASPGVGSPACRRTRRGLGRFNMILDAYRAHANLSAHARIDRSRIALMGFSRGGQTALYASLKRFHQAWDSGGRVRGPYIPLYASCNPTLIGDTDVRRRDPSACFMVRRMTTSQWRPVGPMSSGCGLSATTWQLTEFADSAPRLRQSARRQDTGRRHQCAERACLQAQGGGARHHY